MPIACLLIFGANPEPFLGAALSSVAWVDYYAIVNTAAGERQARENERTVFDVIPSRRLRYADYSSPEFSFATARNRALELIDRDDFVLLVDADDVHYPHWEETLRREVAEGADCVAATFWHLMVYKDLYQSVIPREIVFRRYEATHFEGRVHEQLVSRRERRVEADYRYMHYGYIKPQSEVFQRWRYYSELEGEPDRYDGSRPSTSWTTAWRRASDSPLSTRPPWPSCSPPIRPVTPPRTAARPVCGRAAAAALPRF